MMQLPFPPYLALASSSEYPNTSLVMALERLHWNSTSNPNLLSVLPGDPGSIPAHIPSVFLLIFCACFLYFQTYPDNVE